MRDKRRERERETGEWVRKKREKGEERQRERR